MRREGTIFCQRKKSGGKNLKSKECCESLTDSCTLANLKISYQIPLIKFEQLNQQPHADQWIGYINVFQLQPSSTPNSTHFCFSQGQTHLIQTVKGLMTGWLVESGVLDWSYNKHVYCWGYWMTAVGNQWATWRWEERMRLKVHYLKSARLSSSGSLLPKLHFIPYIVHYFWPGPIGAAIETDSMPPSTHLLVFHLLLFMAVIVHVLQLNYWQSSFPLTSLIKHTT